MADQAVRPYIKKFMGSDELINGKQRYCLWISDETVERAKASKFIAQRLEAVKQNREQSDAESTRQFARQPYRFVQIAGYARHTAIVVATVSSESREYLPVNYVAADT